MFDIFIRMQRKMAAGNRRRATARELAALDDRLLNDIGIHRSEIGSITAASGLARADRSEFHRF